MGEKTVTLTVKVQLINVKDMMEIEKSRLDLAYMYKKDLHDPDNHDRCDHSPRARYAGM